eukprot:CAMPEP_0172661308 /NCGR_PEP_ID=MMETSP1074-20121228/4612_1 /TAXON_ID=2916 /ORGANISM="Ceratium fusus, Strain PA161109" /LENGTH=105 /DNA_ID=CAMNT_0013477051 /DNA_START=526 /DNA_END=841 /DNA_ORIENTATION=-
MAPLEGKEVCTPLFLALTHDIVIAVPGVARKVISPWIVPRGGPSASSGLTTDGASSAFNVLVLLARTTGFSRPAPTAMAVSGAKIQCRPAPGRRGARGVGRDGPA